MQYFRPAADRGHVQMDWLNSHHSFSFGSYYDPTHMGFGVLRVINDDRIAPNGGFPMHGHRDMEIISYGISGSLAHQDSMGNGSVITAGDIQVMSAGTGVQHSEFNPSATEETHFLQIWLLPAANSVAPRYEDRHFPYEQRLNRLLPIVSGAGISGTVAINQDVNLYTGLLEASTSLDFNIDPARKVWVQIARGKVDVNGQPMQSGDGLGLQQVNALHFSAQEETDLLVFDMPGQY